MHRRREDRRHLAAAIAEALDHKGATERAGTPACVARHKASKDHMPHGYHSSYHIEPR
jgi:hypothetical protein